MATLQDKMEQGGTLDKTEMRMLMSIFGGRRIREKTREKLQARFENLQDIKSHGIFSHIVLDGDRTRYLAGPCYTEEIPLVRNIILK